MFTGIVEERGTVTAIEPRGDLVRLVIRGPLVVGDLRPGESVAVSGVCLTAIDITADGFSADVMAETLRRSSLGGLRSGDRVNLERSVQPTGRLGGHLVQGHVDGVGRVAGHEVGADGDILRIALPDGLGRYVVEKGSICIDGVSLTVVRADDDSVTVALIPTTLRETTLGGRAVGDPVNLEVDVIAKYVEKLLGARAGSTR